MKRLVLTAAVVAQLLAGSSAIHAQEAAEVPVTPSPLTPGPVVPPKKPADATESFDSNAVDQLVTISKNTGDTFIRLDDMLKSNSLVQQLLGTIRQLSEDMQKTLDTALTGVKTVPLNNGPDEIAFRTGSESLRALALNLIAGGGPTVAAVAAVITEIKTAFNLEEVFAKAGSEELGDRLNTNVAGHALAGAAVAEAAYAGANASMARLDGYIQALGTSEDLKTSIDLNTRVMIELTQQTNEGVRTNAATTTLIAAYLMALTGGDADPKSILEYNNLNR